jgi:hypothetical protein
VHTDDRSTVVLQRKVSQFGQRFGQADLLLEPRVLNEGFLHAELLESTIAPGDILTIIPVPEILLGV